MRFEFSAGAIIYRENKEGLRFLLLIKENGEYDIPKGHIEKGESSEIAAKREIREESGLDVSFVPGFHADTRYFFYSGSEKIAKRLRIFLAKVYDGKARISYEHKGYEWLEYKEAYRKIRHKDMQIVFERVSEYIMRMEKINALNQEYEKLPKRIRNWDLSGRLVPGEGPLDAKVMLVGQAPGRFEDEKLRPFVGRSGILLGKMLHGARMKRENVYITSVVQFFPPKNRMPTDEEISACESFLKRQIEIIKPRFIITLGSLSGKVLLGVESVEEEHGKIIKKDGIAYMVTFHPAAALRFKRVLGLMREDLRRFGAIIRQADKKQ